MQIFSIHKNFFFFNILSKKKKVNTAKIKYSTYNTRPKLKYKLLIKSSYKIFNKIYDQ